MRQVFHVYLETRDVIEWLLYLCLGIIAGSVITFIRLYNYTEKLRKENQLLKEYLNRIDSYAEGIVKDGIVKK